MELSTSLSLGYREEALEETDELERQRDELLDELNKIGHTTELEK